MPYNMEITVTSFHPMHNQFQKAYIGINELFPKARKSLSTHPVYDTLWTESLMHARLEWSEP